MGKRHSFEIAPAAFWTGLLTETYVRDIVLETTSHWTKQDRLLLNNSALSLNKDQKGPSKKKYCDHFSNKWEDNIKTILN